MAAPGDGGRNYVHLYPKIPFGVVKFFKCDFPFAFRLTARVATLYKRESWFSIRRPHADRRGASALTEEHR